MIDNAALIAAFTARYGAAPTLIGRAPGRVNLIGEHTDYNEGFVFPVAIDREAAIAARPRADRRLRLYAEEFNAEAELDLDDLNRDGPSWSWYVAGMAALLEAAGHRLVGADLLIMGDVPTGSGLSSSAALEVAAGSTLTALSGHAVSGVELAQLGQQTEHQWIKVNSGIMDQLISAIGQRGHGLMIDCRDYQATAVPIPGDVRIVVCDSKKSRELAHSAYNERRAECEEAVRLLQATLPEIRTLRNVTSADLAAHGGLLPATILRRARHIVTEDERVLASAAALERGDLARFGQLMNESHASLRNDYAVSSLELDTLVAASQAVPGVYGARLTGAGFGGCTVALVEPAAVAEFTATVGARYREVTGRDTEIYVCTASAGTSVERLGS